MEQMLGPQGGLHRARESGAKARPVLVSRRACFSARPRVPGLRGSLCGMWRLPAAPAALAVGSLDHREPSRTGVHAGWIAAARDLDILSGDIDWRGGYERVLGALGAGTRRRSRIAGRAQQRIDYTLDRLRRAGYVRAVRPHGAPSTADPLYEIVDPYLVFWFAVLRGRRSRRGWAGRCGAAAGVGPLAESSRSGLRGSSTGPHGANDHRRGAGARDDGGSLVARRGR